MTQLILKKTMEQRKWNKEALLCHCFLYKVWYLRMRVLSIEWIIVNITNVWEKEKFISQNVKIWIKNGGQENDEIQFKKPCLLQRCTYNLESYYRVKFFYMGLNNFCSASLLPLEKFSHAPMVVLTNIMGDHHIFVYLVITKNWSSQW